MEKRPFNGCSSGNKYVVSMGPVLYVLNVVSASSAVVLSLHIILCVQFYCSKRKQLKTTVLILAQILVGLFFG